MFDRASVSRNALDTSTGHRLGRDSAAGHRCVPRLEIRLHDGFDPARLSPMALTDQQRTFLTGHNLATLATLKRDGRPQLSQVMYHFDPDTATFRVSVTDARAKTANLRRDPRATFLVAGGRWEYLVIDGDATLSEVTREPNDAAGDALVDLYRVQAGEHPDWEEYRAAMVAEQRLVLSVVATHAYGMLPG